MKQGKLYDVCRVIKYLDCLEAPGDDLGVYIEDTEGYPAGKTRELFLTLSNFTKITAHWLTYICDRQRQVEVIWSRAFRVFVEIARDFENSSPKGVESASAFCSKYFLGNKGWCVVANGAELAHKPMPQDSASIRRTLTVLPAFGGSIPSLIQHVITLHPEADDNVRRLAAALYLVSYDGIDKNGKLKQRARDVVDILRSSNRFDEYYRGTFFDREGHPIVFEHKRLWAALRDYLRYDPLARNVANSLDGASRRVWNRMRSAGLWQLELPGDIWNSRFSSKLLLPLATTEGIFPRNRRPPGSSPELARAIAEFLDYSILPMHFDVSFTYAGKMCKNELCAICPFGGGATSLCANRVAGVCCAFLDVSDMALAECDEKCPVANLTTQDACAFWREVVQPRMRLGK